MKQNKKLRENARYAATKSLLDEKGKPLEWEVRALSTKKNSEIRESCTKEVPIPGKPGLYRPKVNSNLYLARLVAESVVFPDLYNKELQDSYGVMTPEDLVMEMVDNAGEFNDFVAFIQNFNDFDTTLSEKVEAAKN